MKRLMLIAIFFFTLGLSAVSHAETVVEYGVPIVVEKNTYVTHDPAYYYYEGHRCYTKERPDIGVNFLGLRAGVGTGHDIYCYPYP